MSTIAVSTYSLRQQLGPVRLGYRDTDGVDQEHVMTYPQLVTLEELPALVKERLGCTAIEVCQIQWEDPTDDDVGRLGSALREAGTELRTIPVDIGDLASPDPDRRTTDVEATLRWLDIAAALGARFLRVNAGTPLEGAERDEDALVSALRLLGDAAAGLGVRLLVENHGGRSSDVDYLRVLLDRVGSERLGLLLDLGNFEPVLSASRAATTGEEAPWADLDLEPLYAAIAGLADRAELVHAKSFDAVAPSTASPFDPGRALRTVFEAGYSGPVTVEYEGEDADPWTRTLDLIRLVQEQSSW